MSLTSVQLDWNQPLLPAITQRLLGYSQADFVDLSAYQIVVPTQQAGRRLMESLALGLKEQGRGLLRPDVVTPDQIFSHLLRPLNVASEDSCAAAWFNALSGIDPKHFQALFPIEPALSTSWKIGMARRFMQLRNELGEEGLDFAQAATLAAEASMEVERWRQLARLEGLMLDELKLRKLLDPKQARREAADQFRPQDHIEHIILAATPDPQPLPLRALKKYAEQNELEVWTYGPGEYFDEWGRPLQSVWSERALDLENWNCHLQTLADPADTAKRVATLSKVQATEAILLGLADPNLNPVVADAMNATGVASYDPEGIPVRNTRIGKLAELLCLLAQDDRTSTLRSLLQHPDLYLWLASEASKTALLKQLDTVFETHLAADLPSYIYFAKQLDRHSAVADALTKLQALQKSLLTKGDFIEHLSAALQTIYETQETIDDTGATIPWKECAEAVSKLLQGQKETGEHFPKLSSEYRRDLFSSGLTRQKVYPNRAKDAHDLLGWLELLWNDAPQLILAGMNESIVPESIQGDTFLPETMRVTLGLRSNDDRFARDAYLLEALCRRRKHQGGTYILIPQTAADATPLKPSRILFQGATETLIDRTRRCFASPIDANAHVAHSTAWQLSPPPDLPMPEKLSVSALRNYLQCPFRFFLQHILEFRQLDIETRELSPAKFGTLFHDTLETLRLEDFNGATEASLYKTLSNNGDRLIAKRYGTKLSFALRLQREALLARLSVFAKRQAEAILNGYRIDSLDTEENFNIEISGLKISGIIDRIDGHAGQLQLIDYKTADSPKSPAQAHLKKIARKAPPVHLPEEAFIETGKDRYRWTDLQLPLYALAKQADPDSLPTVAYFNCANTLEKSSIQIWDDFSQAQLDSAKACAAAIIEQIRQGIFWPPNPDVREEYDDFATFFPDGIEQSVDAEAFMNYQFRSESSS